MDQVPGLQRGIFFRPYLRCDEGQKLSSIVSSYKPTTCWQHCTRWTCFDHGRNEIRRSLVVNGCIPVNLAIVIVDPYDHEIAIRAMTRFKIATGSQHHVLWNWLELVLATRAPHSLQLFLRKA